MANSDDENLRFSTEIDRSGLEEGMLSMESVASLGGEAIAKGLAMATEAMIDMSAAAIRVGSDFELEISKIEAISGATEQEMQALAMKAKDMGATTQFSATQSAEAFNVMAQAGWNTQQSISGLPGVMNLAAVSGKDLASISVL